MDAAQKAQLKHPNLVAALAAFHAEAPKVIKDAKAKVTGESKDGSRVSYSYGYADLATVTEALNPLLGKHGMAFTSKPTMTPQGFGLVYALKHEGGDVDEGFWPLPDPTRVKPQDLGSWITYWRRYAFLSVTNTFPSGEDDDGKQAQQAVRDSWESAQPRQQAAPAPTAAPKVEWTDEKIGEYHRKISSSDVTLAVKGYDWLAKEGVHERKIPVAGGTGDELTATQILAFRLADLAVQPDTDLRGLAIIRANAEDRGLINVKVSNDTTLGEELALAKSQIETVNGESVAQAKADTPDPADLK